MPNIFKKVSNNITISFDAVKHDHPFEAIGHLDFTVNVDGQIHSLTFIINNIDNRLQVSTPLGISDSFIKCVILCGIQLSGPILDCYDKNSDWDRFVECLKKQKNALATSALGCVAACQMT